jgi:hypothetical protein
MSSFLLSAISPIFSILTWIMLFCLKLMETAGAVDSTSYFRQIEWLSK